MFYNIKDNKPLLDSICFVQLAEYEIKSTDLGVYVKILDYDSIDGFIPLTEISKYKINLQKVFKHDKIYPCTVFSYEKNIINLSFIKIKEEKRNQLVREFSFAKKINDIREFLKKNSYETPALIDPMMYESLSVEKLYNNIIESPNKYYNIKESDLLKTKITYEPTEALKNFKLIICQEDSLNKLKLSLKLFQEYFYERNIDAKIECISSPIYSIRIKYIKISETFFEEIFKKFEEILSNNKIHCILDEMDLNVYKSKKYSIDFQSYAP
jgi:translation initiation factor 2 alpha subunit (eIF-2alpha)